MRWQAARPARAGARPLPLRGATASGKKTQTFITPPPNPTIRRGRGGERHALRTLPSPPSWARPPARSAPSGRSGHHHGARRGRPAARRRVRRGAGGHVLFRPQRCVVCVVSACMGCHAAPGWRSVRQGVTRGRRVVRMGQRERLPAGFTGRRCLWQRGPVWARPGFTRPVTVIGYPPTNTHHPRLHPYSPPSLPRNHTRRRELPWHRRPVHP
jgi:hypothetical protein